eukprot:521968_1
MALVKAIQFRHLVTQLTKEERVGLLDSHTDIVLTSLFYYFIQTDHTNQVNILNESVSTIIQSRKDKPKATPVRDIKLHQLPKAIIGFTASFLDQYDYIACSMSNRSIYLGCHSPNLLRQLDLTEITDDSCIHLQSFPSVKKLWIDPSKAMKSQHNFSFDSPIFNQITSLILEAKLPHGWVQQFLNQNIVNCGTVTTLNCEVCADVTADVEMKRNEFLTLLTQFPNLKHLTLSGVIVTDDFTAQELMDLCPKIIGLNLNGGDIQLNECLIRLFASKLKYLAFAQYEKDEFNFDTVIFGNLEELIITIFTADNQLFDGILKSAPKLKKISIELQGINPLMNNDDIKNAMEKVFMKCPLLNHLYFKTTKRSDFCSMFMEALEGIQRGLFKIKNQHKKEMIIAIRTYGLQAEAINVTLNVGRLVQSLESSDINDFMFVWNFFDEVEDDEMNEIFQKLCNVCGHNVNVLRCEHKLIIANLNCKINGLPSFHLWTLFNY